MRNLGSKLHDAENVTGALYYMEEARSISDGLNSAHATEVVPYDALCSLYISLGVFRTEEALGAKSAESFWKLPYDQQSLILSDLRKAASGVSQLPGTQVCKQRAREYLKTMVYAATLNRDAGRDNPRFFAELADHQRFVANDKE